MEDASVNKKEKTESKNDSETLESKVGTDETLENDTENRYEAHRTEIGEKTLLGEITELLMQKNKSDKEETIILKEIKNLLTGLTKEDQSNKEVDLLKEIAHFKDNKVWVTRKTRMESEVRMNNNNIFSLIAVNFYTLIVLGLSILGLVITDKATADKITVLTLISSVALFGISLFVSLFGYKEKALAYKQCYLDLTKIESQCQDLLLEDLEYSKRLNKFNEIKKEYQHTLEKTDNHSFGDRLVYLKNNKKLNTLEDQISYKKYKITNGLIKLSIFIIPFVALIIILFVWK